MTDLVVNVKLWDKEVGAIFWDKDRGLASFQFYRKYIKEGWDLTPIVMPLGKSGVDQVYQFPVNRNECFKGLPGLIADALPDKYGTQIITEWFTSRGLSNEEITPLDSLCYIGKRAMGALEFEPTAQVDGLDSSSVIHINELTELADMIFKNRDTFQEKLLQEDKTILDILKIGTSAGGAKPKAIIALNDETGEVRSGQVKAPEGFTYWLLKFDGTTYSEHDKISSNPKGVGNIEYAYHRMAVDAGIRMTECRLLQEGDCSHFLTKRFDRTDDGEKIHMQTLSAMAHFDRDVRHSYEEAFALIRKLRLNYPDQEDFFRRMVFNVVARNHDDHCKNHCFLMDKYGTWSLAPAYDLCYSYSPSGRWTNRHQMSINGKQDEFTKEDLLTVGNSMGINKPNEIIEKVVSVVSEWPSYAKDSGVRDSHITQVQRNLILF